MAAKMTATVVPVLASVVIWMFATFETASGAEQKWIQHNQAITCRTVYELQGKKREYLKQLKFDKALTNEDRDWIKEEIKALEEEIKRLDSKGVC